MAFYLGLAAAVALARRHPAWALAGALAALCTVLVHPRFAFLLVGAALTRSPSTRVTTSAPVALAVWAAALVGGCVSLAQSFSGADPISASVTEVEPGWFLVGAGGLVVAFLGVRDRWPGVRHLLDATPLQYLGKISFSLYLWQGMWMHQWAGWLTPSSPPAFVAYAIVCFVTLVALSHLSYRVIELDGRDALLVVLQRSRRRAAGARSHC